MQRLTAQSTCEAELLAATLATKEVSYLRNLVKEFNLPLTRTTPLHVDNQSAIDLSRNPTHHSRSKHFAIRTAWLREQVECKELEIVKIDGTANPADMFTKPLPRVKYAVYRDMLLGQGAK